MNMYKIAFYVPEDHLEIVKNALFAKGAGKVGQYDNCCWQTLGKGQFRPLAGSHPTIGSTNRVETVEEFLVEMVCAGDLLKEVLAELVAIHPYETPAYSAWKIITHEG